MLDTKIRLIHQFQPYNQTPLSLVLWTIIRVLLLVIVVFLGYTIFIKGNVQNNSKKPMINITRNP